MSNLSMDWFRTQQTKKPYPFTEYVSRELDPATVDPETYGHHRSFVFDRERRLWAFEQESGRDKFREIFKQHIKELVKP